MSEGRTFGWFPQFMRAYADEVGYARLNAEQFVAHYASQGWRKANGQPVFDWRAEVTAWKLRDASKREDPERPQARPGESELERLEREAASWGAGQAELDAATMERFKERSRKKAGREAKGGSE